MASNTKIDYVNYLRFSRSNSLMFLASFSSSLLVFISVTGFRFPRSTGEYGVKFYLNTSSKFSKSVMSDI